jgi:L-asparaginase/Glu-tRNA(Gln) amidotransferase subunit D
VAWVATGGTIQAVGHDRLDFDGYGNTERSLGASEILQLIPEITDFLDVRIKDLLSVPSHNISDRAF